MYEFNREEYEKRVRWFTEARFGMFIHWGIYAVPGRGEWVKSQEKIPDEVYDRYFEEFDPDMYDPKKWAKLAKKAGMKYAVLTTKHHDGFCLFDSAFTDYKATNTKAGRDLVREYVDEREKKYYLSSRQEESRIGNDQVKAARREYRGQGEYIEEILK